MGGGSSGSTVSGGGGIGAAQVKQEQDAINNKSQLLKTQSVAYNVKKNCKVELIRS